MYKFISKIISNFKVFKPFEAKLFYHKLNNINGSQIF